MKFLNQLKPKFWDHKDAVSDMYKHMFNFRRIWKQAALVIAFVALVPIILLAIVDYQVTQSSVESEILLRTSRLVSNTRRALSFFLVERRSALNFIIQDNSVEELSKPERLSKVLDNIINTIGDFGDLSVIDHQGRLKSYVGTSYKLEGVDYSNQDWFHEVAEKGMYISDVFLGFRNTPHLVIAVKKNLDNGTFIILRASLDIEQLKYLLYDVEMSGLGDAFIINREGILQTSSSLYGDVLTKIPLEVPEFSELSNVIEAHDLDHKELVIGYAYIEETPFVLLIVKPKDELMQNWYMTRVKLIGFLIVSIAMILCVVVGMTTHLVGKLYVADQRRVMALHHVEYSNKMASIGRLAAGVAHEINNPLAIINEKAGLVMDLFQYKKKYADDPRLFELVNSIINSVERCGIITRRLLRFARHTDVSIQVINIKELINEVFGFLSKEASYRSIEVLIDIPDTVPELNSDRVKLQQIFLNLFNNAFAALEDGGVLKIEGVSKNNSFVLIKIIDNGCGIPQDDLSKIFEPFFTTKSNKGGTGLGLSITYGLIKELGGDIYVQSELSKGTTFTLKIPIDRKQKEGNNHANPIS